MDQVIYKKLKDFGDVRLNVLLSKYTTLKVGGPAQLFLEVRSRDKFVEALNFLSGEGVPFIILGGGSNLLFSDAGYEGVVIKNLTANLELVNNVIEADSGVIFGKLTNLAVQNSLSGLEWSAGLPGTVGGAVRGNAGASGGDTGSTLSKVEAWIDGEIVELKPNECGFDYRNSNFKRNGGSVLRAWFKLTPGDQKGIMKKMQDIVSRRITYYPPFPSAGSFFKNVQIENWPEKSSVELKPEFIKNRKVPAGWINEQAGLKGKRIGGAMVSEQHGNFIINRDSAKAKDVLKLVDEVKMTVYNKFKVDLEEEVHIIR
jgi:UDP-N-acetylmuramate dehydrogenase